MVHSLFEHVTGLLNGLRFESADLSFCDKYSEQPLYRCQGGTLINIGEQIINNVIVIGLKDGE